MPIRIILPSGGLNNGNH